MQLKDPNLHLKLQEMCDCYMDTDFVGQMAAMPASPVQDIQEESVKYLSLAIMYGVTEKARKLSVKRKKGETRAMLETSDAKIELPQPTDEIFDGLVDLVRTILHFEEDKGKSPLSLGLRNSQLDLQVKIKEKDEGTSLKIKFPKLGD